MNRMSRLLVSVGVAAVLLTGGCFSTMAQAQIVKPQGDVNGSITREDAISKANAAASGEGYDFSRLPLLETKANLVYSEEDHAYEWVVSHIVENEADPYLLTTIDALTGTVLSTAKTNYFELYDEWELQRQLPHDLWSMEDLVFLTRSIDGLICFQDIRFQRRTICRKKRRFKSPVRRWATSSIFPMLLWTSMNARPRSCRILAINENGMYASSPLKSPLRQMYSIR